MAYTPHVACVSLHDIDDAESFTAAIVKRSWLMRPSCSQEWEDAIAEGVCILLELAAGYEEHRPGYERPGSFRGYAAKYLPLRLDAWWLRQHREHQVKRTSDGRRVVEFGESCLSADAFVAERDLAVLSSHGGVPRHVDLEPRQPVASGWQPPQLVHDAICHGLPTYLHDQARGVLAQLEVGYSVQETAWLLGMRRPDVEEIRGSVASALVDLGARPAAVPTLALPVPASGAYRPVRRAARAAA